MSSTSSDKIRWTKPSASWNIQLNTGEWAALSVFHSFSDRICNHQVTQSHSISLKWILLGVGREKILPDLQLYQCRENRGWNDILHETNLSQLRSVTYIHVISCTLLLYIWLIIVPSGLSYSCKMHLLFASSIAEKQIILEFKRFLAKFELYVIL